MERSEREKIFSEAREIMKRFSKSLAKVQFKEKDIKREVGGFREEVGTGVRDARFRKIMFENAPETVGDFLVAERKEW